MSPTLITFLFEAANFLLLAVVLGWAFFRPVQDAIERRRAALKDARREAERARGEADRRLAEAEARQREVEASLEPLRAEVRREAERQAGTIVAGARTQAAEERARLEADLAAMRRAHAATLVHDAAVAAAALVGRVLEEIGGPDLDAALARQACARLATLLDGKAAGPIEVESAHPLDADSRARLAAAAGPGCTLHDRVVPELGAGLRVITHAGLVDASVAGLAAWVERALAARLASGEALRG